MAHLKKANAMITHPRVTGRGWSGVRRVASSGASNRNLSDQAREILGGSLDPDQWLFSHCTIVASVDTEAVPGVKLGEVKVGSTTVDRRFADYHIKPECSQFVNNNGDSWSREVLLASYPTFVGGHNFQEHVQIEEKSKGRIIDAVARDIGDSIYIDILVATNRKHAKLIADIESGKMGTLSMGCFLPGTMVSLANGTRVPIEEIQPGDMVLTHKGRARPVANVQIRRRPWSMRRITAVGVPEELVTTSTHPFFMYRAPTHCACGCGEELAPYQGTASRSRPFSRRFKTGHDKRVFNHRAKYSSEEHAERKARLDSIMSFPNLEEVEAGDLRPYDYLVFPRSRFDSGTVDPGVSVGRAKLLGYFLSEGSFLKHSGERWEIEFSFGYSERDTYVAEVADLLEQEFGGNVRVRTCEERQYATVRLYHKEAAAWFYEYGGEYASRKRLKEEVLHWPEEHQKALLGAWVNGDGWLGQGGSTNGVTTSYDLACQLHLIASRVGAFCTVFSSVETSEGLQVVNGDMVPVRQENGKLPAYSLRFGQTQAQVFSGYSDKIIEQPHFGKQDLRVNDDYVMFPITSIESEPFNGFVYDLEVEEDHSYVVEGVAVHNCTTDFTICTKCGHYAVDETDLCQHIKAEKLNTFLDDDNQKRVIAELCGHIDHDETGGVHFIEASWVAVPAFTGAVMRNILETGDVAAQESEIRRILSSPTPSWSEMAISKAASLSVENVPLVGQTSRTAFDFGGDDAEEEPKDEKPAEDTPPFKDLEDEVYERVKGRVRKRLEKEMQDREIEKALAPAMGPNDTLNKEAFEEAMKLRATADQKLIDDTMKVARQAARKKMAAQYKAALQTLVRVASSDVALVDAIATTNAAYGVKVSAQVYRAALVAGGIKKYSSPQAYLARCQRTLGREPTLAELRVVVRVGTLLSQWESANNNPPTLSS